MYRVEMVGYRSAQECTTAAVLSPPKLSTTQISRRRLGGISSAARWSRVSAILDSPANVGMIARIASQASPGVETLDCCEANGSSPRMISVRVSRLRYLDFSQHRHVSLRGRRCLHAAGDARLRTQMSSGV